MRFRERAEDMNFVVVEAVEEALEVEGVERMEEVRSASAAREVVPLDDGGKGERSRQINLTSPVSALSRQSSKALRRSFGA
jgi:hypothetical protein